MIIIINIITIIINIIINIIIIINKMKGTVHALRGG